jgi:hypothetical protein
VMVLRSMLERWKSGSDLGRMEMMRSVQLPWVS